MRKIRSDSYVAFYICFIYTIVWQCSMSGALHGSDAELDKRCSQQESGTSQEKVQGGIAQEVEQLGKQSEEFIRTCIATIRQLLADGVVRKDNLYLMYKEIVLQLYGEKSQLSPTLLISGV